MRRQQDEVREIVLRDGVILRRDHPELRGGIERLLRAGQLAAVLPGVYGPVAAAERRDVRLLAVAARERDGVLLGRTAAQLSFWRGLPGDLITCAVPGRRPARAGFAFVQRTVPADLVLQRGVLRLTVPAMTALDLCDELGGDGIDRALRTRSATLDGMRAALELTGRRRGNSGRRTLLLDSRDEPWSAAERLCHRLLRRAGITGWKANRAVRISGRTFSIDVAFPALRLAVEIDGRLHEDDPAIFENDRWRQNALMLDGWLVLRFTWAMLRDHPDVVVRDIRAAVAGRGRFPPARGGL